MKLFSEYLAEAEQHTDGTYAALLPTNASREKLYEWLQKQNVEKLVEPSEYHCTVVFSTKPVPEVSEIPVKLPFSATVKEWKIFGDHKMLVAALDCSEAHKLFDKTIEMGAKTDYPEYVPHITIAQNYTGEIPEDVPDFRIVFYKFKVAPLDADFEYSDDDK